MAAFARGQLIALERKQGTEVCLVVEPPAEGWFRAITPQGKIVRFPTSLPAFGPIGQLDPRASTDEIQKQLAETDRALRAAAKDVDTALLRSCVLADPRPYSFDELAELLVGPGATLRERGALAFALLEEAGFDREGTTFAPVDDATLSARRAEREAAARAAEAEKARARSEAKERRVEQECIAPELKLLVTGRARASLLSPATKTWLAGLRRALIEQRPSDDLDYGRDLVKLHDENHAIQLLARAGLWRPDEEDLGAIRGELGLPFPDEVVAASHDVKDDGSPTRDLTGLDTFTIDGLTTSDLDDAITIEENEGSFRVWIHIADVARWIPRDSVLDRWGRQTGESIYLPERTVHLFPEPFVRRVSLDPGEERAACTLSFRLSRTGDLDDVRFEHTRIRSRERLDYHEADRRFREDPVWSGRLALIELLQRRREARGARIALLPDIEISIRDGATEATVVVTDTPAHRFVSELMVFYNEQIGFLFQRHGVPAIFKTQPEDTPQDAFPEPEDPLYFSKIVRLLRPSISGLDAARHAFMGVDAYCQATSPIRRYADLLHQRQLTAWLRRGEPEYTRDDLAMIYPLLDGRASEVRQLERRRRRYWLLKHLDTLRKGRLKAIVSQIRPGGRPVVFFPDLLLEVSLLTPPDLVFEAGDELYVTPKKVDPIRGGVWAGTSE